MEQITMATIREARQLLQSSGEIRRTPVLSEVQSWFPSLDVEPIHLHLKLENMQTTGSFKIRGVCNQLQHVLTNDQLVTKTLFTFSAGNYGKAFAYTLASRGLSGLCLMPTTAPKNRVELIRSYGIQVEQRPTEELEETVSTYVGHGGYHLCHPYDDPQLIAGYGSLGQEIVDAVASPEVVIVPCGGGGLVAGVASSLKLAGLDHCRIYAVEPEGSATMRESFQQGRPASLANGSSVACGLCPPYAGRLTFDLCRQHVTGVALVSDTEILRAVKLLYELGLVVEPSGAAGLAALLGRRIPDLTGRHVVVLLSGGNVSPEELTALLE